MKAADHTDIFENLVRGTILSEGQTRVRGAYFDIFMGIGHTLANLVVHPAGREIGESAGKRDFPGSCQSGSNTDHVGFGDTHLKKAFGEFFFKVLHLKRFQQISGQTNHFGVLTTGFE